MNNPAVNILDFSLNPTSTGAESLAGETLSLVEGSPLFGDIMAGLLVSNGIPNLEGQANPTDATKPFSLEQLLTLSATGAGEAEPRPINGENSPTSLVTPIPGVPRTPKNIEFVGPNSAIPQAEQVSEKVVAFNRDLVELLPEQHIVQNESLRNIMSSVAVEVESGRYRIIDSRQVGQSLQLEIVADEKNSQPIKVTLPLGMLTERNETATAVSRVALTQAESTRTEFHRLISDLNLKQIEIRVAGDDATTTGKPTVVTIVAEDGARRVVLEGRMANLEARITKAEVTIGKAAVPMESANPTGVRSDAADPLGVISTRVAMTPEQQTAPVLAGQAGRLTLADVVSKPTIAGAGSSSMAGMTDSVTALGANGAGDSGSLAGNLQADTGGAQTNLQAETQASQARPVSFHLPDNIKTALKSHRQSITIMIKPDHLGPARLTIVERNGILQASLVVDSPEARSLIEGSLDKLTRQLEKADIKIDSIGVTVGGDEDRHEGFERKADWQLGRRSSKLSNSNIENPEDSAAAVMPPHGYQGYAGAGGVDLLA